MTLIREKHTDFVDLCRSHKVEKMYAFGSSITDPADRGEALLSLWDNLEMLLERKVDLLTEDSIRNPYLKNNIDRTKKLIYDRSIITRHLEPLEEEVSDRLKNPR